jgi:AraC-like DNA-binding protein
LQSNDELPMITIKLISLRLGEQKLHLKPDHLKPDSDTSEPQTILSWANAIAQALETEGIDSKAVFEQVGMPYQTAIDPEHRVEASKIATLFSQAVAATQNPAFGLKVILHMHPASYHALGYSLYASNTLYDYCQRIVRFFRFLSESARHELQELDDSYALTVELTNVQVCKETLDGWMGCIVQGARNIYRPDFAPLRVEMMRPEPDTHAEDYRNYYKAPVIFSCQRNVFYFDKQDMLARLPSASTELSRMNDEVVIQHLARLDRKNITRQVEAKIIELLPTGDCSKEKIATELNVSVRALHQKLEQKNTSYQKILDKLRADLARQYIEQQNMPISQITYLLGFSDTSNFSRAFRRWTGQSPSDFRKQPLE